jgi:hypothetical protein
MPSSAHAGPPDAGGVLRRATRWIVPRENPAAVVYGALLMGALLAAESGQRESYLDTAGSAAITAALFWFAHAYAALVGRRLAGLERGLSPYALVRALLHAFPLIRGAAVPLVAVLLAWATGGSQETALAAGLWTAVASLVVFELVAGLGSRSGPAEIVLEVAVGATMGLGVLALKAILH